MKDQPQQVFARVTIDGRAFDVEITSYQIEASSNRADVRLRCTYKGGSYDWMADKIVDHDVPVDIMVATASGRGLVIGTPRELAGRGHILSASVRQFEVAFSAPLPSTATPSTRSADAPATGS